jgi:predicted HicB family RNase H-like nuclease
MPLTQSSKAEQRMVHVRLETELHRRLRIVAAADDASLQDWIAGTVERAVDEAWPKVAKMGHKK